MKPPFLLLDPPANSDFCRRGSLREKDSANNAPFPNIDLILLSGAVREAGFEPLYLDAQIQRLGWADVLEFCLRSEVQGVLSLISSAKVEQELSILKQLKADLGDVPLYVVGTIILLRDRPRLARIVRENPWLDGLVLNVAENNLTNVLRGGGLGKVPGFNIVRGGDATLPEVKVRYGEDLRIPQPQHALFKNKKYCFPQSKRGPVTCVQWSFGCPFTCEFCIDNQLYRKMLYRNVDDMIDELVEVDRLGFREVYFKDLTFGLHKRLAEEFLRKLAAKQLRLRWLCTTRVDVATPDLLALMKKTGCYGIEFGVEHARESKRRMLDKKITDQRIREVFAECRRLRIETTAFIMLAFEDDTQAEVEATIRFARRLRPNYVSFNVVNALPGTPYEERARREGFLRETRDFAFAAGNIRHKYLTPKQVEQLRRKALRSFYFSPAGILQRLLDIRSFFEFKKLLRLSWSAVG